MFVELDDGVMVLLEMDPETPNLVDLSLHWRNSLSPVGQWPYYCEASVLYEPADTLLVVKAPSGRHGECCPYLDEELTGWRTVIDVRHVDLLIDRMAEFPRADWRRLDDGLLLWRGELDASKQAVIELVTDDVIANESSGDKREVTASAAVVDLGLSR